MHARQSAQNRTNQRAVQMISGLSRKERERLARRQEMLLAARSVFAEKGYSGATLDEIAHRSEFGKGTIYNYFEGGKEEILIAILNQMYDETASIASDVFSNERLAAESIRQLFSEFLTRIFTYLTEHRDVFIIHVKEAHAFLFAENRKLADAVMQKRDQVIGLLRRPIEYGIESGQLRPLPADAVSHMLLGNIKGIQMQRCLRTMHGSETDAAVCTNESQAEFLISVLFDGLLNHSKESDGGNSSK
ncbi:MAG: TetR/AcrR family transcriptional regulator [Bacteroidetes bacterium]|nr:TetR/AcrR family transcriptional regulator [Bacteroidota bacterium]